MIKADIKDGKNSGDKFELLAKYLNRIKRQEKFFCDEYLELEQYLKNKTFKEMILCFENIGCSDEEILKYIFLSKKSYKFIRKFLSIF